jgi:acetyl esterase/lipase
LLAKYTKCLVIYVEYRLIPEFKYPTAYNDSLETAIYLIKNNRKYQIDLNRLVIMGDSAGGNLATVISQQLIEMNIVRPKIQVLIYPILQFFDFTLPSYREHLNKGILGTINKENFKSFIYYFTGHSIDDSILSNGHTSKMDKELYSKYVNRDYLPQEFRNKEIKMEKIVQLNHTYENYLPIREILLKNKVSPLLVEDDYLERNTPDNTILLTTEIDILRDDGFIYSHRLKKLQKNLIHLHFDNLFHGIFGLIHGPFRFDKAHYLVKTISEKINQIL